MMYYSATDAVPRKSQLDQVEDTCVNNQVRSQIQLNSDPNSLANLTFALHGDGKAMPRNWLTLLVLFVVWSISGFACLADEPTTSRSPRKLIEFGWDEPDTHFLRSQITQLQQTPFDGCVFHVNFVDSEILADDSVWAAGGSGNFSWAAWGTRTFTEAQLSRSIADLQAIQFGRFAHNFVRLNVTPAKLDWFDDYASVITNCRLAAQIAHRGGCAGILFDTEQYDGQLFNYSRQRDAATKTWAEYAAQARQRGGEVMQAFQEAYPDITLLLTFGHSLPWVESQQGQRSLAQCDNGLLAPFLDGMIAAANGQSKIVDGYELSYGYRDATRLSAARQLMKEGLLHIVEQPERYHQVVSSGFGLWLDYRSQQLGWDVNNPAKNYFTPECFKGSLGDALNFSDEYVWVYSEKPRWWTKEGSSQDLPDAYAAAIWQAIAPYRVSYLPAKAYYVLPETHNNQSGYFSLCEGLHGKIYIGTARYGENSHLVEFDPSNETQQMVLDTHKTCGLNTNGYAAQAKIHTRNFVGPSGTIYVGSKQGYRLNESDTAEYPGGYAMMYDPRIGAAQCLGMPFAGQGIADIVADESRGLLYVVTCEDQHWMRGGIGGGDWRELGPMLTPYAMTLVAADGKAYALTKDFELASYDPTTNTVQVRTIEIQGTRWTRRNEHAIPTWVLNAARSKAFLILMNDPTLLEIDLTGVAPTVPAVSHGKLIEGGNPDSRCGLDLGADGKVYGVVRVDNETGFGMGYLHHLLSFDPQTGVKQDLGVLTVENPDYFDWNAKGPDNQPLPWTHGFHRLPDGTLTPLHAHMALKVAADNTIYVTIIYPFTLLRIDQFRLAPKTGRSERYLDWALKATADTEAEMERYTRVAEIIAERHLREGMIGFPFEWQAMAQDLWGRSGGLMHIGFTRAWKPARTVEEKANDVALIAYERAPNAGDLETLQKLKARGVYIVGFGPAQHSALRDIMASCDVWFDSGFGENDLVVEKGTQQRAGHGNIAANAIHGWTLMAEFVGAMTRQGKMPVMWKGYAFADGRAWGDKYFGKLQFHDDYRVETLPQGELGRRYLQQIRYPIRRLHAQADLLRDAAKLVSEEIGRAGKVHVVWQGHMPPTYIGKMGDDDWAVAVELHPFLADQVDRYRQATPDDALILNLGYHGLDPAEAAVRKEKRQRVIHLSGDHPDPAWKPGPEALLRIDLGFAFGDACVTLEGYPIRLFAPSGIAQVLAYEAIKSELELPSSVDK